MATSGGPNIVTDGLVFGYDVGLPFISSSKDTSYRFNKGVPITNVARALTSWPTKARATVSLYSGPIQPPIPGEDIYILSCSADNAGILIRDGGFYYGGGFAGSGNAQNTNLLSDRTNSYTPVGNNKFIYSLYVRPNENTLDGTAVSIDIGDKNSVNVQNVDDLTDWHKLTTNDSSGINSQYPYDFFDLAYTPLTIGNEVLISSIQILRTPGTESGSLTTPGSNNNNLTGSYIQHLSYGEERSFTNSLLDLTGTRTIDLSYAGFNETQLSFDGTDDRVEFPNIDVGNNFTVEIVAKVSTLQRQTLFSNGYTYQSNKGFLLNVGNANDDLFLSLGNDQYYRQSASGIIPLNEWFNVTATYDGTVIYIYFNGTEVNYSGGNTNSITNIEYDVSSAFVGAWKQNGTTYYGDWLDGEVSVVKVYNRALSSEKIKQNYNAIKSRFGLT